MSIDPRSPAERLLAALVTEFGSTVPARVYISHGIGAAWDCSHLAVCLQQCLPGTSDGSGSAQGLPSHGSGSMQIVRGSFQARILRCVPTVDDDGALPAAEAIQAASVGLLDDLGMLLAGIYRFLKDSPNGVATVGAVESLGPDGGLAGYATTVVMSPLA